MKLYAILALVLALVTALGIGGRALYHAGYDARVAEESKAYDSAEAKGRKDQEKADSDRIAQLQQALTDATQATKDRQATLDAAQSTVAALQRKLAHDQNPDNRRWLDMPLPCGLQLPPACPSTTPGDPGH